MECYSAAKKNEILSFASKWMGHENITLSQVIRLRGPKITCSPSYTDYRPETNAVILLDMVTHQGENMPGRNRKWEGHLKLECG
jgi:hypothetical protein